MRDGRVTDVAGTVGDLGVEVVGNARGVATGVACQALVNDYVASVNIRLREGDRIAQCAATVVQLQGVVFLGIRGQPYLDGQRTVFCDISAADAGTGSHAINYWCCGHSNIQLIAGATGGATHVAVHVFHFENNAAGARERGVVPGNGGATGWNLVGYVCPIDAAIQRTIQNVAIGQRSRQRGADGLGGDVGDLVAAGAAVYAQGCAAAGNGDSGRLGVIGDGDNAGAAVVAGGVGVFAGGHGDAGRTDIHMGIGREGGGAIKLAVGAGLQARKCAQASATDHDIANIKS